MWIDLVCAAILIGFGLLGALRGLISQVFGLIAVVAMALFAVPLGVLIASPIAESSEWGPLSAVKFKIGMSLAMALLLYVTARLIGAWVNSKIGKTRVRSGEDEEEELGEPEMTLAAWNRYWGTALNVVKGALICWLVLCFFVAFSRVSPSTTAVIAESWSAKTTKLFNPFQQWMPPDADEALVALWKLKQNPDAYDLVLEEESIQRVLEHPQLKKLLDEGKGDLLSALRDEELRESLGDIDWTNVARIANEKLADIEME